MPQTVQERLEKLRMRSITVSVKFDLLTKFLSEEIPNLPTCDAAKFSHDVVTHFGKVADAIEDFMTAAYDVVGESYE